MATAIGNARLINQKFVQCESTVEKPLLGYGDVILAVQEMIENLRNNYGFLQLLSKVNTSDEFLCNKRHRKLSRKLNEFLLYDSVTVGHVVNMELKTSLKQLYYKVLDTIVRGFCESSKDLIKSIYSPQSGSNFFDLETLKYLGDLSDVNVLAAEAEITTAKIFLQNKFGSEKAHLVEIIAILHGYKEAFPNSYQLVAVVLTIGISSATCEASVSTCSRLLSPFRRSMAHARMSHLVIIFFERSILESISNEELLRRFYKAGNHRLQLH
ncbi:hypothetical protein T11_9816 [Trichinella zimbabwensis]|uniref:HAT C-terminal dimerisation domain-containing protein n=1 Tax=Trichinella zimbabwensis TaxID=268475 RepID=A0A0V1I9E1_9BILA|nr:hypothetical protein T11_9816 [Trichinella zimbabwensis]